MSISNVGVDDKTYAIGPKSDIKTFFQKVDEYFMLSLIHHDNITANYPLVLRAFFKEQTNARVFLQLASSVTLSLNRTQECNYFS